MRSVLRESCPEQIMLIQPDNIQGSGEAHTRHSLILPGIRGGQPEIKETFSFLSCYQRLRQAEQAPSPTGATKRPTLAILPRAGSKVSFQGKDQG